MALCLDQDQAGLGEVTGPGVRMRGLRGKGKGCWETYFLGGVMSLLLPVGLVNGGGSGQEG